MNDIKSYTNGNSKNGKQLLFVILVLSGTFAIINYISTRKKTKLEVAKLQLEIDNLNAQNKKQHPIA